MQSCPKDLHLQIVFTRLSDSSNPELLGGQMCLTKCLVTFFIYRAGKKNKIEVDDKS